jgi:hypothetical protein
VSRWHAAGAPDRPLGSGRRARAWLWPLVRPHRGLVALGALAVLAAAVIALRSTQPASTPTPPAPTTAGPTAAASGANSSE